jgi:Serine kinase of the HPr protein, regulates carbohydrate metabolism
MHQGSYKIAGHSVEIDSIYEDIHRMCEKYKTTEEQEFCISIRPGDIRWEREKSEAEDIKEGVPVRHYTDDYLETLAVYRKLSEWLVEQDILLFHGSAIAVDGQGYLFTAKSGTGKSTHTGRWRELFGERAVMINDDKPLLHITGKGAMVYGTPWDGKHHLSSNTCVPLKAICILSRASVNHIERIDKSLAYPMLLQQSYRSVKPVKMSKILAMLDLLTAMTGLYELGCNMEIEAARVAYEGMK